MNAMQKLVARRNAARRNGKKGFTLVELIIVIAILAALVAILAPQYTKYVEKSRESADKSQLDTVINAVKVALVDPDNAATMKAGTVTLKAGTGDAASTYTIDASGIGLQDAIVAALGASTFSMKSKAGLAKAEIDIVVAATSYAVSWKTDTYPVFTTK